MKKSKLGILKFIGLGLLIILLLMNILGLTFSLPTTFKDVVIDGILDDEQLVMTNIDTERITYIEIANYDESYKRNEVQIRDKDMIHALLNNEVRLYRTTKFMKGTEEYDLYIHFYGTFHRYFIGENYIREMSGDYKVIDDRNEVFESVKALFEAESN